ncbi:MAG: shikimate dehydrogenase [Candidatus Odinarchaeia archaeon]
MCVEIDGETRLCCLIGNPVSHSLSPLMQNLAFKIKGLNIAYIAFPVKREQLADAIKGLKALEFIGANVTIPYKTDVINLLNKVDKMAMSIGAVNTILNSNGELIGYNTDGLAAFKLITEKITNLKETKVLILGAGGVARAISYYLAKEGVELLFVNRTVQRALNLIEDLRKEFGEKSKLKLVKSGALHNIIKNVKLIINATPLGMWPNVDNSPLEEKYLTPDHIVFDTVYNPLETRLIKAAKTIGCPVIEGYKMLVLQGAFSFKIWTGEEPPIKKMERIVYEKLKNR